MTVQLNKPRPSSVVPLRCANQSCSYYERNKDLDLDSQKLICLVTNVSLGSELVVVLRPFANEKSIIFEFLSELMNQWLISKKLDVTEEMHRPGGFRNTARWLKSNRKLVE